MNNAFNNLKLHLNAHVYKKGDNKGRAPLDKERRGNTGTLVIDRGETMVARKYSTDIVTAFPNGDVVLHCRGWASSSTTRDAVGKALGVCKIHGGISMRTVKSLSQLCMVNREGVYAYYDGMILNSAGDVTSPIMAFKGRRLDKAKTTAFKQELDDSGFKAMFKILHGDMVHEKNRPAVSKLAPMLTDSTYAGLWSGIIQYYAWDEAWSGTYPHIVRKYNKKPADKVWASMMAECKRDMYEEYDTGITKL